VLRFFKRTPAPSTVSKTISDLAIAAKSSIRLGLATEHIAFHDSVQHLSVREEEYYQSAIRLLHRQQHESWFSGVLIPSKDDRNNRDELALYLSYADQTYKVGRLRHSMVTPVFARLAHEMENNGRVVPVIGKVIPGGGQQSGTILAYAKTDLVDFPVY